MFIQIRLIYFLFFVMLNMPLGQIFFVQVWKRKNGVDSKIREVSFDLVILNASEHRLWSINTAGKASGMLPFLSSMCDVMWCAFDYITCKLWHLDLSSTKIKVVVLQDLMQL